MESDKYNYRVFWWSEDESYVAQCGELPSISGIGSSPEEALAEAKTAAAAAVEWMKEEGEAVPTPTIEKEYKGRILLRISPETHRLVSIRAEEEGRSVNQFLNSLIEKNLYTDTIERSASRIEQLLKEMEALQEQDKLIEEKDGLYSQDTAVSDTADEENSVLPFPNTESAVG